MKVLVTGAAGFIGSKVLSMLAARGDTVVGVDSINDYYDVRLKLGRLRENGFDCHSADVEGVLENRKGLDSRFVRIAVDDRPALDDLFAREHFDAVVHLAAQAGVRYSITNPYAYLQSNLTGMLNVLEACRHYPVRHLVFASSSSVYGKNTKVPYSEEDKVASPVSLYAATKLADEHMAHSYACLYGLPCTGLRFFTVYGPWGRPDMAPMLFADAVMHGRPIKVFNHGDMIRDFTFIEDIAEGTIRTLDHVPGADSPGGVPYRVYNIGCSHPVRLMDFIAELEEAAGRPAVKEFLPMQAGDVYQTNADVSRLVAEIGYKPHVTLHEGMARFMAWYKSDLNPLR